jgi:hypothetical protein
MSLDRLRPLPDLRVRQERPALSQVRAALQELQDRLVAKVAQDLPASPELQSPVPPALQLRAQREAAQQV